MSRRAVRVILDRPEVVPRGAPRRRFPWDHAAVPAGGLDAARQVRVPRARGADVLRPAAQLQARNLCHLVADVSDVLVPWARSLRPRHLEPPSAAQDR